MATDADGSLYVGIRRADYDTAHTGVLKLDRDWKIVAAIGFDQPGDPVFNAVHDLAVGRDGSIYVAETRTKRVVKLRPSLAGPSEARPELCRILASVHGLASRLARTALFALAVSGYVAASAARVGSVPQQPVDRRGAPKPAVATGSAGDARHLLRRVSQPAAEDRRPDARHRRCGDRRTPIRKCSRK